MSTFLTLHSKKALFTHGNLTAKSSGANSVELFKVNGETKEVILSKDADTIFKNSDGTQDLLKIAPDTDQMTSQSGVIMKTLDGVKTLLSLDASNTKLSTDEGLKTKTNVNLQTESGTDLLILDAVSTPSVTSLQAPYLEVTNQFKTSGQTELDGAVNISGVTTVDNKLNVNGTIDINGGDLILDENSQLIVAGGSELNVIGDEGIHWFSGGLDSSTTGGHAPTITIGGSSVGDFSGEYVRKTGLAMVPLPDGNGQDIVRGDNTNGESNGVFYFSNATQQFNDTDYFFHEVHNATSDTDTNITYLTDVGEYYWNKDKGSILIKTDNDWLGSTLDSQSTKLFRSNYFMNHKKRNNRDFRKNGQTQWVLLRNTAWINQDDMPQFSYDSNNNTQTNGYFKPVTALADDSDANIIAALQGGQIPLGTSLNKLWDAGIGNYNYATIVNGESIRKFHLPHFSGSTLFNKVVDNDAVVWEGVYTTGSTEYDNKEYTLLFKLSDLVAPTFDSSGAASNTIPYGYYLSNTNTDGKYFGYFVKKYNLALTVEETSAGSNIWNIKTDVNNDYRFFEAQLPTSNGEYHYRYIMHADNDFGKKFFSFMIGQTNGITNGEGWFVFSTTEKLNPGISQVLGEFDLGVYTFSDSSDLDGHPASQFQVNGKSTKFVPNDAYYTSGNTTIYDSQINRDSQLIPYHEDHEDGQTMGLYNQSIGWHSSSSKTQYNIGWGYPFTSNGGDVTLSNLNIRGNMSALGNSYINELYGGTSNNNSAPPLLVTNLGTSLSTTPLDYYESTAKKTASTPFFSVVPDSLSVEVKDNAQLDVQTTTGSESTTSGALVVAGGVGIGEKLNVANNTDLGGTLTVTNGTTLESTLSVTGITTLGSTLNVTGVTTISDATPSNDTTSGALVVSGGVGIGGKLNVASNADLGGTLNVTGGTTLESTLRVTGVTTLNDTTQAVTDVNGNLTAGALLVSGGVGIEENLKVKEAANVGGDLTVTGATTLDSTLSVTGATTLKSTLSVTGVTTINDTTQAATDEITGDLTAGALLVSGGVGIEENLKVKEAANVGGALTVTGATTLDSSLNVTGAASLASTLGVGGATTLSNALTVQTDALVVPNTTGAITMARDLLLSSNKITCQNIEVKGTMTTINTEEVNIKDNHIVLNSTHTATTDKDSGIVSVGKASGTIVCTIDSSASNRLLEVDSGTVTSSGISPGDIILITSKAISGDNSDKNNGLYVVHNIDGSGGALTVKTTGVNHIDFCRTSAFDTTVSGSQQYDVSKVSVHHMYFDTDTANGNSIKYGYGEKEADFEGYGYLDLTQGDVRSSFEEANLSTANHTLNKSITRVTAISGDNKLILPNPDDVVSKLVDGTTYKVINSTTSSVTIDASGSDGGVTIAIELGDGTTSSNVELYSYSTITLTYANGRWYVL